jgi:hypothetical protein
MAARTLSGLPKACSRLRGGKSFELVLVEAAQRLSPEERVNAFLAQKFGRDAADYPECLLRESLWTNPI